MLQSLNFQDLITAGAILAAIISIVRNFANAVKWVDRQKSQDDEIKAIKNEQAIITRGLLACLKGLEEQGCDGPVKEAIAEMEKHLNEKAHR